MRRAAPHTAIGLPPSPYPPLGEGGRLERKTMSNAAPPGKTPTAPPREIQPIPGLLSLLVPGLGQIYQGRVAKGVLFLVCIYGLFFYGMWLGSGTVRAGDPERTYTVSGNVYLPVTSPKNAPVQGLPP